MLWWIALGVVAFALVVLVVCVLVTSRRLRGFADVVEALRRRAVDLERVREAATDLRERAEELRGPLLVANARAAALRERGRPE